jgi:hypothetical protein
MSYDLFAFDPDAVASDDDLMAWYQNQAKWAEPHTYLDPAVSTPTLQAFYRDLIKVFPPMNGPDAPADDDGADTDYSIGTTILYAAFRWPMADHAREVFLRLGRTHGVGVCEISESHAAIHRPAGAKDSKETGYQGAATYAVKEFATIFLSENADRAAMQLNHMVRLIGENKLFMILFRWPDNVSTDEFAEPEDEFLQTTGSQSGLTVELMRGGKLYTLGRPGGDADPVSLIRKDGTSVEFKASEVLSPDEAVELFKEYRATDSIDTSSWSLREIPFGSEEEVAMSGPSSAGVSDQESATQAPHAEPQSRLSGDDGAHDDDTGKAQS